MAILDILGDGSCKVCIPLEDSLNELSGNHPITSPTSWIFTPNNDPSFPFSGSGKISGSTYDNNYIDGDHVYCEYEEDWTITIWVKDNSGSENINFASIAERYGNGNTHSIGYHLYPSDSYCFTDYDGQTQLAHVRSNYTRNSNWRHISWVKEGIELRHYIDGVLEASDTLSDGSPDLGESNDMQLLRGTDVFELALFRIFDRVLDATEIGLVMNEKSPPEPNYFDDVHIVSGFNKEGFIDRHTVSGIPYTFRDIHTVDMAIDMHYFNDIHSQEQTDTGSTVIEREIL